MKTLYESILDDEDVLVKKLKQSVNWQKKVFSLMPAKKLDKLVDFLNKKVQLSNDHDCGWDTNNSDSIYYTSIKNYNREFLVYMNLDTNGSLYVTFMDRTNKLKDNLSRNLINYDITEDEFLKIKQDIIKTFKLKQINNYYMEYYTTRIFKDTIK